MAELRWDKPLEYVSDGTWYPATLVFSTQRTAGMHDAKHLIVVHGEFIDSCRWIFGNESFYARNKQEMAEQ